MIEFINRLICRFSCLVFLPIIILKLPDQISDLIYLMQNHPSKKALPHNIGHQMANSICLSCGESEYRQFLSAAADEAVYLGIGNPLAG